MIAWRVPGWHVIGSIRLADTSGEELLLTCHEVRRKPAPSSDAHGKCIDFSGCVGPPGGITRLLAMDMSILYGPGLIGDTGSWHNGLSGDLYRLGTVGKPNIESASGFLRWIIRLQAV